MDIFHSKGDSGLDILGINAFWLSCPSRVEQSAELKSVILNCCIKTSLSYMLQWLAFVFNDLVVLNDLC